MQSSTIKEIARLCGLSRATVSAVLNGKPGVSERARTKVYDAMRENRLRPRLAASSLVTGFGRVFGMVVPDIRNPFYMEFMDGLLKEMKQHGHNVICKPTDGTVEDEISTLESMASNDVSGFVLVPSESGASREHILRIVASRKPLVILGSLPGVDSHTVEVDNRVGAKAATDLLLRAGHKRLMYLGGPALSGPSKERMFGFVESLVEHSIFFDESMMAWTDGVFHSGHRRALEILADPQRRPTGVLCFNDILAAAVYRAAHELGLRIPGDLSVVGFDDIELAQVLGPPLTTVATHPFGMGRTAAQVMLEALKQPGPGRPIRRIIPAVLVERGSVAPPAAG